MLLLNRKSAIGNRKSGVTLIEIVISIFILSVGVLGILSLFPSGYRLSQSAIDRSVATLASQDAIARLMAQARSSPTSLPGMGSSPGTYNWNGAAVTHPSAFESAEPLFTVRENDRVGMVNEVDSTCSFKALICGDVTPQSVINLAHYWPTSLAGYYVVMTSGTMAGSFYKITSSAAATGQLTFSNTVGDEWYVNFRVGTVGTRKTGDPIRVGDQFAIIGSQTGASPALNCYPTAFLNAGSADRTVKVATEGDNYANDPWLYSYGAIVSAPTPESPRVCRVDVFVYRGVDYKNSAVKIGQTRPAGWIVTYVPNFSDFTSPDN